MPTFTFERTAVTLLFLVVAATACLMPAQSDTWWHLREGQVLWNGGTLLTDYFSHTVPGGYWQDREWLSQVVFFAPYRLGGLPVLTLLGASIVTLTWLAIWSLLEGPLWSRILVTILGVTANSAQWSLRPQLFTLIGLAITLVLLSRVVRAWSAIAWLIPLVFLVWANLHGGVVVGLALLVVAVGWSAVSRPTANTRRLAVVAATAFAATAATPLRTSLWTDTFSAARRMKEAGITEFAGASLTDPLLMPFWLLCAAFLVLLVAARPWQSDSRARHFSVAAAVALLPLGVMASRNAALVALIAVPALHYLFGGSLRIDRGEPRRERPRLNAALVASVAVLATVVVVYNWTNRRAQLGWTPIPEAVAASVESCRAPLYNRFTDGGPLIWFARSQKVFIDNRFDPYPTTLLKESVKVEATGNYRPLFDQFRINCAALPAESLVAGRLRHDGWRVVADEGGWMVIERQAEKATTARRQEIPVSTN